MCGYCIEGCITLDFIEREKITKKVELENNWVPIYLQESANISEIICKLKQFDNLSTSIDIVIYRIWEMILFQENYEGCQSLLNVFETESLNDFIVKLKSNSDYKVWGSLGDSKTYADRSNWERFISNKVQLIEDSTNALKTYYNFWILGNDKETSDPAKRLEETGIMDPIENTTPKDWDRFYSLFPVVYFSYLVLSKYQNDSNIIKHIALEGPHDIPDFFGYDLWLQRKAFTVCIKNYGVQFILDNYDDIRLELIYYGLLKESICVADLDLLKNHLLSHCHWVNGIDADSVVELINNLKSTA